jgi:DNA repair protein RadC
MNSRIKDLAIEDRPREKMQRFGVKNLTDEELMALFLRTGVVGKSAIQIGRELIQEYGSLARLGQLDVKQLAKFHGLGPAKATQLLAAFELGSRVASQELIHVELNQPSQIYQYFSPQMSHLANEKLLVVLLNTKLQFDGQQEISTGNVNQTLACVRDILKPVITRGSYAFLLIHNHPSGDPRPSNADTQITQQVRDASSLMQVRFIDHIILGRPSAGSCGYYSFKERGLI